LELTEQVERDRHARQRSNTVLDGEFETFERSWNLEKQLQQKDDEIKELTQKVLVGAKEAEEMQEVAAELQMLRTREEENATLRARLERSNQRLEEVGELKVALAASKEKTTTVTHERDSLVQELGQMMGIGQQLDAWKVKVHDLELRLREAEAVRRTAEGAAQASEAEHMRLEGEKVILVDQLQESQLQVALLRDRGPCPGEEGDIIEPFTAELRERMQSLEARNALLEQQLTLEGSERVAQLVVEVESLRGLKEHYEQQHEEAVRTLTATQGELEEARQEVGSLREEVASIGRARDELGSELTETKAELVRVEDERDSASMEVEAQGVWLEELKKQLLELQEEQGEAARLRGERDALRDRVEEVREALHRKEQELADFKAHTQEGESRRVELERQEKMRKRQVEELQRQLDSARCEGALQARTRADLREKEEVWAQRQGALESGLSDLRSGLDEQLKHSAALKEQVEATELQCQQLEDILRRAAPAELQLFLDNTSTRRKPPPAAPGPELELAQARAENRRLQAALGEQRLRTAEEAQQLARTSAQLRHLQRAADEGRLCSAVPAAAAAATLASEAADAGEVRTSAAGNDGGRAAAVGGRVALRELPTQQNQRIFENSGFDPEKRFPSTGADDKAKVDPSAPAAKARMPRNSILKKPKCLDAIAAGTNDVEQRKENLAGDAAAARPALRASRAGLLT